MKFIRLNYKAIILVLFVMISEVIYLPFSNIKHHESVSLGVVLYHFFAQIGYISFLPALFLYWSEKNIDSKGIYLGLVIWNVFEVFQEINVLFKINIEFLNKSDSTQSDILQIIFIIFVVGLTFKAYKNKCNT